MKRLAPLLAATLFALTACTAAPAASETTAEAAPSTTEETAAEPAADSAVSAGRLHSVYESTRVVANAVYEVIPTYDAQWNPTGTIVYKTDLSAGQTTELYQADGYYSSMPLVTADTLYLTNANKVLALPLDGGAPRTMPVDAGEWETPGFTTTAISTTSR